MPEILQDWLGTRTGVLLDMSPQKFGRNTKDGKLLANLLYSYGVIPVHVLEKIKPSQNFYECYDNLAALKPWLEHIGVVHEESTLEKMAGGEGSAAISVFYAVYLNLERSDRLHYISAQKERRFTGEDCRRDFKIDWVPEKEVIGDSTSNFSKFDVAFIEKSEMIEWHRKKCQEIVENIKRTKEKFAKTMKMNEQKLGPVISKHASSQPLDKRLLEAQETEEKIRAFEIAHDLKDNSSDLNYSELVTLQNVLEPCMCVPNEAEAKNILSNIKRRKKGELYTRNFQEKMQNTVLDEQWKSITDGLERDFEDSVCKNLLKQSQYEKQMACKLHMIRNQKKVLVENRRMIDCLKMDLQEKDYDDMVTEKMEMKGECWEEEEFEKERSMELHRRIYDQKVRARKAMLTQECQKICEALVSIAIRVSEIRDLTGCQVPKAFMKDLKELFYKDLSIFDLLDNYEELYDNMRLEVGEAEEEEVVPVEDDEQLKILEAERQAHLNECDFNDYMNLLGPWMVELLFPDSWEAEVKHVVLGYIVHKLLDFKYPQSRLPPPALIKPMKPVAVVRGLTDDTACKILTELMEACCVLVVRVDDAINFVLAAYKEEMSAVTDFDATFQRLSQEALKGKENNGKPKIENKKLQLLNQKEEESVEIPEELMAIDKQTQTPRNIPDDDPILSPNAEIGRIAFEALGAGDPVPDSAIVSAISAYVASKQDDYDGWVLLNYPMLYSQASDLEFTLTGYRILPLIDKMDSLEDVEGFSYREQYASNMSKDDLVSSNRKSRLVPQPELFDSGPSSLADEIPKTYFDSFIVMTKVMDSSRRTFPDSEDLSPLERFYQDQEVLITFEYKMLNFQVVKNLGKRIMVEGNMDPVEKTSLEIFGNALNEITEKWDPNKKKNGKGTASATKKPNKESNPKVEPKVELEAMTEKIETKNVAVSKAPTEALKPGDPGWEWATGTQPESFQLALASLWEKMEAVYIEDFKEVFFCLRVHRSKVVSYSALIRKAIKTLVRRPDEKQKILSDFQRMYNDIDVDLRPDVDIKGELHVRVYELEQTLMAIADDRKLKSQNDLSKVVQDGWVSDEMANLVNIYLTAVQLEVDRCTNSCQVIMDYYLSLQQKIPDEKTIPKIAVAKLQVLDRKYSITSSASKTGSLLFTPRNSETRRSKIGLEQGSKTNVERTSKTRSWTDKRRRSSESRFLNGASEVIMEILTNLALPEDGLTPFHTFFMDNVQAVSNHVKTMVEECFAEMKKGDKIAPKNGKKPPETKPSGNDNLNAEWTTALNNELERFLFRMKLILARGIFEMNDFLTMILNVLSSLAEEIIEMYLKEIQSIVECCKVFRCAIEEEIALQPQLELRVERFVVNYDVLFFEDCEKPAPPVKNEEDKFRFTVDQLSILCQKLQCVAPDGEIIKQSMVYIFEDLRTLKEEVGNSRCFPEVWDTIQPDDLSVIFREVYQNLEIVNWKDFIIYALDIPVPTEGEILDMRKLFRSYDSQGTELITRENYDQITFWFENLTISYPVGEEALKAKDLLYRMYQVNELQTNYSAMLLAFCKDEDQVSGFKKALALSLGKKIVAEDYEFYGIPGEGEGVTDYQYPDFIEEDSTSEKQTTSASLLLPSNWKCIPRDKIIRCTCPDVESSSTEDKTTSYSEVGEVYNFDQSSSLRRSLSTTSVVPYNNISSIILASFPSLPQLSILLDCKRTFQETLNSIYDSFESYDNSVEVHKILKHEFIKSLIQNTNKFKYVRLKDVVERVGKARSASVSDKLNDSCC